ncbi:MAG: hypothetical protein K2Y21_14365 [Phycisphaerales bacterium]|nr:hypothetical protein [Phycisphaerales bacterium]
MTAIAAKPRFELTGEIPVSAKDNRAYINIKGWVTAMTPSGPIVWKNGILQSVPTKSGRNWATVSGLNDFGDVSGTYNLTGSTALQAWAWSANQLVDGATGPSWMQIQSTGINNKRDIGLTVVPFTVTDCGSGSTQWYGKAGIGKPNAWKSATAWKAQCTPSCTVISSLGYGVNNAGDILAFGYGTESRANNQCSLVGSYFVSWGNGASTPVPDVYFSSTPSINDVGQVLSNALWNDGGVQTVGIQIWSLSGATRLYSFGVLKPGMTVPSGPLRFNSFGQVIASDVGTKTGFYTDGKWYDLKTLVKLPPEVSLSLLLDINELGQVVASGKRGSSSRLFVLTLQAPCPADFTNDGMVDDADYAIFASAYDAISCPAPPQECPADLNLDGIVDDADFGLFLLSYEFTVCP